MKKNILAGGLTAFLVAGALSVGLAAPASAAGSLETCTPADAWVEVVEVPAVGEPTITIENPDYVPAVEATDEVSAVGEPTIEVEIENPDYVAPTYVAGYWETVPAEYTPPVGPETIDVEQDNPDYVEAVAEIPEVSHTDYHAEKYVVDVPAEDAVYEDQVTEREYKKWKIFWTDYKWFPANADPKGWTATGEVKIESVKVKDAVEEQGHWDYQTFHEQPGAEWTVTSTEKHITQEFVAGSDAVGEPTIWVTINNPDHVPASYTPAYDVWVDPVYTPAVGTPTIWETQDNPDYVAAIPARDGTPAVGEPTIEVENLDYVEATTNEVEHDAVTCPVIEVPADDEPADEEPVAASNADDDSTLAVTGGGANLGLMAGGALALLTGAGFALKGLRRRA